MKTSKRLKRSVSFLVCCGVLALGLGAGRLQTAAHGSGHMADDGVTIYEAKCAGCHGKDGRGSAFGKKNGVPDFTDAKWQEQRDAAKLEAVITNGKGGKMPAWKDKLSAGEIESVVARVRAFGLTH